LADGGLVVVVVGAPLATVVVELPAVVVFVAGGIV
jgi:hypothetical protein